MELHIKDVATVLYELMELPMRDVATMLYELMHGAAYERCAYSTV